MSTSFQSYQSIFCLRLLKPLKSTTIFSSNKNCPREISSLPALGGNLAFILTFPYDHSLTTKGIILLVYLQSRLGQKAKASEYLIRLLPSAGVLAVVHQHGPQHSGLLGMVILFAKLSFI